MYYKLNSILPIESLTLFSLDKVEGCSEDDYRVDRFGNVLYFAHRGEASKPLAWSVDHTTDSIANYQALVNKAGRADNLLPWWELQCGIPIHQFKMYKEDR
jgi:hypothetical protein